MGTESGRNKWEHGCPLSHTFNRGLYVDIAKKKLARSNNILNTQLKLNALLYAVRKEHLLNSTEVSKSESS
jgi:hypothetical protein